MGTGYYPFTICQVHLVSWVCSWCSRLFLREFIPGWLLLLVMANHFWLALAVSFNENFDYNQTMIYLSGVSGWRVPLVTGPWITLGKRNPTIFDLNQYYGHVYEYPRLALVFLLASLGLMGFPISPTFVGVDLLFSHISPRINTCLASFDAISYIFWRHCPDPYLCAAFSWALHVKNYHATALKSS